MAERNLMFFEDLDLGMVLMKELVIKVDSVDIGVYMAAKADINYIGLVGIGRKGRIVDAVETLAMEQENVQRFLEGATVRKVIVVPGKLVNIVAN